MKVSILDHPKIKPVLKETVKALQITEVQYYQYLINKGSTFLAKVITDGYYYKILINSKAYWAWYINQFTILDKAIMQADEVELLKYSINGITKISLLEYWLDRHNEANFTKFFINSDVIELAESEFIAQKVKERV